MQRISYNVKKSSFRAPIEAAIRESGRLARPIEVNLGPRGLERNDVLIVIDPGDSATFGTDWEGTDPSWFSARLRAAATVLRDQGLPGRYRASHCDGVLTLRAEQRT
jgi:hypothetical protein